LLHPSRTQANRMRRRIVVPSALVIAAAIVACGTTDPVPTGTCDPVPMQFGTEISGAFTATDCNIGDDEQLVDNHLMTLAAQTNVRLTFGATGFDGDFELDVYAKPIDIANFIASEDVPSVHYAVLPAGEYLVMMQSFRKTAGGSYTIKTEAVTELNGCFETQNIKVSLRPGVSVAGRLNTGDCVPNGGTSKLDRYWMPMAAGKSYTFSTTGTIGLRIEVVLDNVDCAALSGATGTVSVTCVPTTTGKYNINVRNINGASGDYVLTVVQPTG
jgi:hypothetical protein